MFTSTPFLALLALLVVLGILYPPYAVVAADEPDDHLTSQPWQEENLLKSIAHGQVDIAYRLLAEGHTPNVAEQPSGWTPLIHATSRNDFRLASALLDHGADINTGCADGWTPIMFACVHGHIDLIRMLLARGANIHLVASSGATALGSAILGGNPGAVRLIEEAVSEARLHEVIFEKEQGVEAVILSASYSGDHSLVERLLREGHSANTISSGGWSPLMLAAAGGSLPTMRVLLRMGAEVDAQDHDGWTPLHFCTHASNLACVSLLLEAQADIFLVNKHGHSALRLAAAEGHERAFNLIVSMTYCHELISGHAERVQEMQADGVDPSAIDCSRVQRAMAAAAANAGGDGDGAGAAGDGAAGAGAGAGASQSSEETIVADAV